MGGRTPLAPATTVVIQPRVRHALAADAGTALEFYALTVPAFSPSDYVAAPAP